ncbi:hypothetical protein [Kribbella catacumbae]|uniref:hypothetical protein n=1 Tax=Kribbella catacumbae TaxID=460086 RepID=UPI00035C8B17|nr:hypothetical protein [Kribbella catacumbae]
MNPTDKVDDLLAKAGAEWRAGQPSAPEPDLDRITGAKTSAQKRRRWVVPALAAASVAAIATAALIVLPDGQEPTVAPPPNTKAVPTPMTAGGTVQAGKPSPDDLLVRNGDRVEVNGGIIAAPGQQPVYCPSRPVIAIGYPPGKEPAPSCPAEYAVKLTGLDLDRLSLKTTKGVRSGVAHLVGIWNDKTIKVEEQSAYRPPVQAPLPPLPCAAPPGGWPSRPSNMLTQRVQNFLDAKADQIYGPITFYPNGHSRKAPVVFSIGVAHGDLEAFRKTFETIHDGNLCLHPVKLSRTENERIGNAVSTVMQKRKDLGIYSGGGQGFDGDRIGVSMLAFTEQAKSAFAPVGLEYLDLDVAVKPVR